MGKLTNVGAAPQPGYADTLRSAMNGTSRRQLSGRLAGETGNKRESEYRALGKYLSGAEVPSPERAAILAVLLGSPAVALVPGLVERRGDRLAELEDVLDELVENQRQMLANQEEMLRLLKPARGRRSA